MVTIRLDRKVFYGFVIVLALALALGAGLYIGRLGAPAASSPAAPAAPPRAAAPQAPAAQAPGGSAPKELPAEQLTNIPRITLEEAHQKLGQPNVVFVDARSTAEYQQSHIKGAVNLPLAQGETRKNELPRDKDLIIYCA